MRICPIYSTGKEKDEETGYGYFGARYMDHELMTMWLSVDPMADKYPSISPYAYCAWNPVKLVDPDGMRFDSASMIYVNQFYKEIDRRIENNPAQLEQYEKTRNELLELEKSNQLYRIENNSTIKTKGGLSIEGYTEYSLSDNAVQIHYNGTFGALAHELKHAYQFEKGYLSFNGERTSLAGLLYGFKNERDAYNRGCLFGGSWLSNYDIGYTYSRIDLATDPIRLISVDSPIDKEGTATYKQFLEERGEIYRYEGQTLRGKSIIVK